MQSLKTSPRPFEQFLAAVGVMVCLIISARVWQLIGSQQPMWPLPGLYLLEMMVMSLLGLFSTVRGHARDGMVMWAIVGVFLAFALMAAWSIGLAFLPVAALFAAAAILMDRRRPQNKIVLLGMCALGSLAQTALMFAVIRMLDPNTVF
jgi:hypothetical protein